VAAAAAAAALLVADANATISLAMEFERFVAKPVWFAFPTRKAARQIRLGPLFTASSILGTMIGCPNHTSVPVDFAEAVARWLWLRRSRANCDDRATIATTTET
jgi:hypothetical protein